MVDVGAGDAASKKDTYLLVPVMTDDMPHAALPQGIVFTVQRHHRFALSSASCLVSPILPIINTAQSALEV
ncbi:hypothetical protein E4U31_007191 [Claviceps sp. LM219 group G6]|nr:hypothetical protein E4U31_007191 [Claviceps sp. LM219 group G6]